MRDIQSIHLRRSQAVVFHKVKLAASRVEDRDHLWPAGHLLGWKVICGPHAGHQCLHPALNAEDAEAAGHLTKLHQPKFALPLQAEVAHL